MPDLLDIIQSIFDTCQEIRYVALYHREQLHTQSKSGTAGASSGESDRYEELLVNPVILKLTMQRGNIDCGGLKYVLIRYGNFYQWVQPIREGHLSVCIEPHADALQVGAQFQAKLREFGLIEGKQN